MSKIWMLVLTLMAVALPAAAQVYEWRDADGRLNYADRPPPGVDAKLIRQGSSDDTTARPPPPTLAERELEFRERRARAAEEGALAAQEAERAEEREQMCTRARNQLAALESGQSVARMNAEGEREVLNTAQRAEEVERSRNFISANCE